MSTCRSTGRGCSSADAGAALALAQISMEGIRREPFRLLVLLDAAPAGCLSRGGERS